MQSYDVRCERPNFAPFKRPTRRRASPFLIVNDKYSCQNLGSLSPNPYFCRISHNKREFFLARTQTVCSANLESVPHSTRSMRPSLAEIQKKRTQHQLAGFCSLHSQTLFFLSNMNIVQPFRKALRFYVDGFRQMTWGKTLWIIIAVKLFVMFAVLRLFFFQPVLKGTPDQKQDHVATQLSQP